MSGRRRAGLAASLGLALWACATEDAAVGDTAAVGIDRGRVLFRQHGCPQCHGPEGQGDGRIAHTLNPPPRDFRARASFRHGDSLDEIAETIRKGVVNDRQVMPAYGHLALEARRSLALYIGSLAAP